MFYDAPKLWIDDILPKSLLLLAIQNRLILLNFDYENNAI